MFDYHHIDYRRVLLEGSVGIRIVHLFLIFPSIFRFFFCKFPRAVLTQFMLYIANLFCSSVKSTFVLTPQKKSTFVLFS
jgi:hypothetical protein